MDTVLDRWSQLAAALSSKAELGFRTGGLLSALGLVSISQQVAAAARKDDRRNNNQGRDNDEARDDRDNRAEKSRNEQESDSKDDSKASAEERDTSDKSGKSEKHDQNEERGGKDKSSDQNDSDSGKSRDDSSRRSSNSDSSSGEASDADDDSHRHGDRRVREFAQQADEPTDDSPPDDSPPDESPPEDVPDEDTATPTSPDVDLDHIPSTSIADLVVEANDHVIATVSSSGGFAFARSGDVIAVTGPDGATIIQTDDVSAKTRGTRPAEPSDDGGNNDVEFSS
jgi:hypothetical protein